jgi:DNA-binding phage protein
MTTPTLDREAVVTALREHVKHEPATACARTTDLHVATLYNVLKGRFGSPRTLRTIAIHLGLVAPVPTHPFYATRKARRLGLQQCAAITGIRITKLRRIEAGRTCPTVRELKRFCRALRIRLI